MSDNATAAEDVCAFTAASRFHQSLKFESKTTQKPLRATYAIVGCQDSDSPTILFAGGLYGGRWNGLWIDYLCQQKKVRVVIIDRPGFGGSTAVALDQRIPVWLETVPTILRHLKVEKVTLAAHSSGVIYLFNTVYHLPEILTPGSTIHLISPWVHPSKSGAKMLTIASAMPAGLVTGWSKMTSFLVNRLMPSSAPTGQGKNKNKKNPQSDRSVTSDEETLLETCGLSSAAKQPTRDYFVKMFFEEDTSGVADEAKLGLKTGSGISWGICDDYETFAIQLAEKVGRDNKLHIVAYFGAKDGYVGKGGSQYFNRVWGNDLVRQFISAKVHEVAGMNHDDLTLPEHGILSQIFDGASKINR